MRPANTVLLVRASVAAQPAGRVACARSTCGQAQSYDSTALSSADRQTIHRMREPDDRTHANGKDQQRNTPSADHDPAAGLPRRTRLRPRELRSDTRHLSRISTTGAAATHRTATRKSSSLSSTLHTTVASTQRPKRPFALTSSDHVTPHDAIEPSEQPGGRHGVHPRLRRTVPAYSTNLVRTSFATTHALTSL